MGMTKAENAEREGQRCEKDLADRGGGGARGRRGGDLLQRGGKDPILPQSLGAGPQLCQHLGFGLLTPRTVR